MKAKNKVKTLLTKFPRFRDSALRGENYSARKGPQQDKWRRDLGYEGS